MKLNDKQNKIIDSVRCAIESWRTTNDINSPTHIVDIHEFIYTDLSDIVSDIDIDIIEEQLIEFLSIIRKYGTN